MSQADVFHERCEAVLNWIFWGKEVSSTKPLQHAGLLTFWSERHLQAGADRMAELLAHLDQATCIVLLLSADFFANEECLALMRRALLRQQNNAMVVIPLVLRRVAWQESELGFLPCLPINGKPIVEWPDRDQAFHACLQGLCSRLNLPMRPTLVPVQKALADKNRERMLRRLRRSYQELQTQSLQGLAWMELGLTERPDAVQNVTNLVLRVAQRAEKKLPPGVSIIQVYEDAEQELLILGEPGVGKSMQLRHLAQYLVAQAEHDETCLLPIILPLSSWAVKRGPLEDWISEQIAQDYDIPHKVSQQWVEQEQILPLLDGLDEMEEAARSSCIAAVNVYHRVHLTPLVVCSRTIEYESAADKQRLALQNAVVVQPLTREQVDAALERAGEAVVDLRAALGEKPPLQDLATIPLMLSVLMLAYQETTVLADSLDETALEQQVWRDYVQRMVERKGNGRRYPLEQTQAWLSWLAQQMRVHDQTIFYAEQLQADWLPDRLQRAFSWLMLRIPAIILGFFTSLLVWLFLGFNSDLATLFHKGLLGGILGGWSSQSRREQRVSARKRRSSRVLRACRLGGILILGILFVINFGFSAGGIYLLVSISILLSRWVILWLFRRMDHSTNASWRKSVYRRFFRAHRLTNIPLRRVTIIIFFWEIAFGLIYIPSDGLVNALAGGLDWGVSFGCASVLLSIILESGWTILWLFRRMDRSIDALWKKSARRRFFRAHRLTSLPLSRAAIITLLCGMAFVLFYSQNQSLVDALGNGLAGGLSFGFASFLLSIILESSGKSFHLAERLHWNAWSLVRPQHLRNSLLVASLLFFLFGLDNMIGRGLNSGLNAGLTVGLIFGGSGYWLLFGLGQGIKQEQVEAQDRRAFNQGIRRTLRNGILISLLGGGITTGVGLLGVGLYYGLNLGLSVPNIDLGRLIFGLSSDLSVWWLLALSGGLITWVTVGGLTILRHYVIRWLLAHSHTFPWRAQTFLDDATARILLQRVGGGYGFVHRRLLDFLADAHSSSVGGRTTFGATNQTLHLPHVTSGPFPVVDSLPDQ